MVLARSRGQGGAPCWTNDLDRGEDRHTLLAAEGVEVSVVLVDRGFSVRRRRRWTQGVRGAVRGRPALSGCAQPGRCCGDMMIDGVSRVTGGRSVFPGRCVR